MPPRPSAPTAARPGYPSRVTHETPGAGDSHPAKPGFVSGAKKARHQRLARMTKWVTLVGLVAVLGLVVWLVLANRGGGDSKVEGCRNDMSRLAGFITKFRARTARMPTQLSELFGPESDSPFDAEPWDCWHGAYEYRIVDAKAGTFRLRSKGPDKKPDTPDDIVWPPDQPWR